MIKCPICNTPFRIKVELFLDIPADKWHNLNKKALRSKDILIDGANWPKSTAYCPKGHKIIHNFG